MASEPEEEFRRLSIEMRILEENVNALQGRMNMVGAVITDLTYARMALEGLEKHKEDAELLVPIGGSSYIKANLRDSDKIIVGMGAGVSVEKTMQEAKEIVTKRMENLEKTRTSLQQRFTQVVQKINEDRARLEELATELRKGQPS